MTDEQFEHLHALIDTAFREVRAELQSLGSRIAAAPAVTGRTVVRSSESPLYGDFPELFPGFPCRDPVDLHDSGTQVALFLRGDPEVYSVLKPEESPEEQKRRLAAQNASWRLLKAFNGAENQGPPNVTD